MQRQRQLRAAAAAAAADSADAARPASSANAPSATRMPARVPYAEQLAAEELIEVIETRY